MTFPSWPYPRTRGVCVLNCEQTSALKKMTQWELRGPTLCPELPAKPCRPGGQPQQAAQPPGTRTAPAVEAAG